MGLQPTVEEVGRLENKTSLCLQGVYLVEGGNNNIKANPVVEQLESALEKCRGRTAAGRSGRACLRTPKAAAVKEPGKGVPDPLCLQICCGSGREGQAGFRRNSCCFPTAWTSFYSEKNMGS